MAIGNTMRLVYMFVHFSLYIAAYTQAMVQISSIIIFIMGILSGVALVVYVPAAFFLNLRKRYTIWDRAFGEVTYITIQTIIWLILGIFSSMTLNSWICDQDARSGGRDFYFDDWTENRSSEEWCPSVRTFSAITWTHFGVLSGWATYLIVNVVVISRHTPGAWGSSMTALMEGDSGCCGSSNRNARRASEKALVTNDQVETA